LDLDRHIVTATLEVFEKMILLEPTPQSARWGTTNHFEHHVTSMLGFSGDLVGMFFIHCPVPAAQTITQALLGGEDLYLPTDINDALGEVTNMVAGGFKPCLAANGTRLDISIPTAIAGSNYSINTLAGARGVGVPFALIEHQFLVEVRYRFNT